MGHTVLLIGCNRVERIEYSLGKGVGKVVVVTFREGIGDQGSLMRLARTGCSVRDGIIFEILRRQVERLASFMEDYGRR